jgi:hypothetical protein
MLPRSLYKYRALYVLFAFARYARYTGYKHIRYICTSCTYSIYVHDTVLFLRIWGTLLKAKLCRIVVFELS